MPDSPRCLPCLDAGKIGQTYYNVNSRKFKCASCKILYDKSEFEEADFHWREKGSPWYAKAKKTMTKMGQRRLDEIFEHETRKG